MWRRRAVRDGENVRGTPRGDLRDPQGLERGPRNRGRMRELSWPRQHPGHSRGKRAEVSPARGAVREADPEPASRPGGGSAGNPLRAEPAGLSPVQGLDWTPARRAGISHQVEQRHGVGQREEARGPPKGAARSEAEASTSPLNYWPGARGLPASLRRHLETAFSY